MIPYLHWHLEIRDLVVLGKNLLGLIIVDDVDLVPYNKCWLLLVLVQIFLGILSLLLLCFIFLSLDFLLPYMSLI